jgi:hypothetical protein
VPAYENLKAVIHWLNAFSACFSYITSTLSWQHLPKPKKAHLSLFA